MLTIVKYNRQIPTNFFVRLLAYARLGLMITARRVCALLLTLHLFIIINRVFLALSLLIFFRGLGCGSPATSLAAQPVWLRS